MHLYEQVAYLAREISGVRCAYCLQIWYVEVGSRRQSCFVRVSQAEDRTTAGVAQCEEGSFQRKGS